MSEQLDEPMELRAFLEAKFERQEQLLKELRDEIVLQGDEHQMAGQGLIGLGAVVARGR